MVDRTVRHLMSPSPAPAHAVPSLPYPIHTPSCPRVGCIHGVSLFQMILAAGWRALVPKMLAKW
eukprot:12077056-Alexandrium_andersonii.AAC.1